MDECFTLSVNIASIELSQAGIPVTGAQQAGAFSQPTLSGNNLSAFLSLLNNLVEQIGLAKLDFRATPAAPAIIPQISSSTKKAEGPENSERPGMRGNRTETPQSPTHEALTIGTIVELPALIQTVTTGQGVSAATHGEPQDAHSLATTTMATADTAASSHQARNTGDIAFSLSLTYESPARILQLQASGPAAVVTAKTVASSPAPNASAALETLPASKGRAILDPEPPPAGQKLTSDQKAAHNPEPRCSASVRNDKLAQNPEGASRKNASNTEPAHDSGKPSQKDLTNSQVAQSPVEHPSRDVSDRDRAQPSQRFLEDLPIDDSASPVPTPRRNPPPQMETNPTVWPQNDSRAMLRDRMDTARGNTPASIVRTAVSADTPTPPAMDISGEMPTEQYDPHLEARLAPNSTFINGNVLIRRSPAANTQREGPLQTSALISNVPEAAKSGGPRASGAARLSVGKASTTQIHPAETLPHGSADAAVRGAKTTESGEKALRIPPAQKLAEVRNTREHLEAAADSVSLARSEFPTGAQQKGTNEPATQAPDTSSVLHETDAAGALQTHSIREISLRLSGGGAPHVDVQVAERAGKIQVAVRTVDQNLAKSLQNNLSELVGRLEQKGYRADAWTPLAEFHESRGVTEASTTAGNQGHPDGSGSRGGEPNSRQDQQGSNQRHQDRRRAQFEETLLASGATS